MVRIAMNIVVTGGNMLGIYDNDIWPSEVVDDDDDDDDMVTIAMDIMILMVMMMIFLGQARASSSAGFSFCPPRY